MYGVFFKDSLIGTIEIKGDLLVFNYCSNFQDLKLNFIPNFPEHKTYTGTSVFSFILNRVNISKAKESASIEELLDKSKAVGHSPLIVKRLNT